MKDGIVLHPEHGLNPSKEKYGYRTRRRMEDIWMVWLY